VGENSYVASSRIPGWTSNTTTTPGINVAAKAQIAQFDVTGVAGVFEPCGCLAAAQQSSFAGPDGSSEMIPRVCPGMITTVHTNQKTASPILKHWRSTLEA
jgi:hypothetical protein